jgi:hypothetical protein
MMETDWLFWAIAFLFFLPMHIGTPLLYLLLEDGPGVARQRLPGLLVRGTLSALAAFGIALLLWPYSRLAATAAIVLALLHPWLELLIMRGRSRTGD